VAQETQKNNQSISEGNDVLNKVMLIGNLGRDAELKYTPGGEAVASVSLATNSVWFDKNNQKQERVEWHRVIIWGKMAESLAQYLVKGKQIYVEGNLQTREWTDKDNVKRYTTEVRSYQIKLLGGMGKGGGVPHPADTEGGSNDQPVDDSDIPF